MFTCSFFLHFQLQLKETEVSELQSIIQEKDEYIVQLDTQGIPISTQLINPFLTS